MSADEGRAFEQVLSRVESLIGTLDDLPDSAASKSARELVQVVLELHAAGLNRLLELIYAADAGPALIERLAADERVGSLLLLHDLHPQDVDARVRQAVERLRPHLGVRGVRVAAVDIARSVVRLRVRMATQVGSKRPSAAALKREIEDAIVEAAPDVEDIHIEGLEAASTVFVPLASVTRRGAAQNAKCAEGKA